MADAYKKEQERLEQMMQDILSDDEGSLFGEVYLSDEYHTDDTASSDDSDSSSDHFRRKRKRVPKKRKLVIRDEKSSNPGNFTFFQYHILILEFGFFFLQIFLYLLRVGLQNKLIRITQPTVSLVCIMSYST